MVRIPRAARLRRRITRASGLAGACAAGLLVLSAPLSAQPDAWPVKPIRLIVGPGPDVLARQLAQRMTALLGQQMFVDPLPGAGGIIAASTTAQAQPDGYTLLFSTGSYTILDGLQPKLPYSLQRDLEPVTQLVEIPFVLLSRPTLPAQSLDELVKLARAQPGKLNCASTGTGTTAHLGCELLRATAKIDIVHVPYKGIGPALTDLIGGQVDFFYSVMQAGAPYAQDGRLRALAVTGAKRSSLLPAVPTMEEAGYGRADFLSWNGIHARRGTPEAVLDRLQAAFAKIIAAPDFQKTLVASGFEPVGSARAEFASFVKTDLQRWSQVIKEAQVKVN
ncbi:MAG: hypothetical protein JWN73_1653 [Betaproteobacteria bacterium]|nr:hypothetical protein [Betaproteobacteria bacterium]